MSLSIFGGNLNRLQEPETPYIASKEEQKGNAVSKNGTIFAGNLRLQEDKMTQMKNKAKKEAFKGVFDKFNSDLEMDRVMQEQVAHVGELKVENTELQEKSKELMEQKQAIKEGYGVEDDSEEQKNLELLIKQHRYRTGLSDETLTEEESEQIRNMGSLTEYQKEALQTEGYIIQYEKQINANKLGERMENAAISGMKTERLKDHGMVDAEKQAEEILLNASKMAAYSLIMEAKDKLDNDRAEEQEKVEEKKEEEQKEEELTNSESVNQNPSGNKAEESSTEMIASDTARNDINTQIKNVMKEEKLLDEEIKGMLVDQKL